MKKFIIICCVILMSLSLFGCEDVTKKPEGELAYISYYSSADGSDYSVAINRALEDYALSHGKEFTAYQIRDIKKDTFISTLELAIKTGATTFVIPYDFYSLLLEVHMNYPEQKFVVLDTYIADEILGEVKNIYSANFNSYETGYIAGYMLAFEEYTSFAYASNFKNMVEERYLSGVLTGLNDACNTIEIEEDGNISKKKVNFSVYDFTNTSLEDIKTKVALAYQSKIDVFFYLGSTLFDVIEDYTERSGFEYVAYCANNKNPENDAITIQIDYSSLLKAVLNYLDTESNPQTNLLFGMVDEVQSVTYDMEYIELSTERKYMMLRDQILNESLSLLDDSTITWDMLKLENVTIERVSE